MDFSGIKSIAIPEGNVKQIAVGGSVFWKISPYEDYTPLDTNRFPTVLNGFYAEPLVGLASGRSSSYEGSVYAKPWLTQDAVKLGKIYSSWGNGVGSFSVYRYGTMAIGYSADSTSKGNKALNIWISETLITAQEANPIIDALGTTILYELFESDGSSWKSVTRVADGVHGYLCTVQGNLETSADVGTFVEVADMNAPPMLMMGGNPFYPPEPDPEEENEE